MTELLPKTMPKRAGKKQFIIVTRDMSGLGFAKMCIDNKISTIIALKPKDDEEKKTELNLVGSGIVPVRLLKDLLMVRNQFKDSYWIWDQNHNWEIADQLRKEGFKVFGGHELTYKMENDRQFGVSLVKKAGLVTPETQEFSDVASGVEFLDSNIDKAYVFKPDEPDEQAWVTTCPSSERDDKANEEMSKFLNAMGEGKGTYILQERKKGVEINVEVWLFDGQPFFAHANFECKRKYNKDLGRLIGCAHDVEFTIPLDCKVLRDTLSKLIELPEFQNFTGMVDMNLIVADREYYFLEFCGRFGYNSHPNLFITLAMDPFSDIISDFMDGKVEGFYKHFRPGFGASILMSIDDATTGLPIIIPEELEDKFFHYDTYRDSKDYFLAGYANEVGVVCGHDYDLKSAADEVLNNFDKIFYPGKAGRSDINLTNYLTNPYERWVAADAMKLFDIPA